MNTTLNGRKMTFLGVYAASKDEPGVIKKELFGKLNETLKQVYTQITLLGGFNSRTGCKFHEQAVGTFGEEDINDDREKIELCASNELKINGFFKHK